MARSRVAIDGSRCDSGAGRGEMRVAERLRLRLRAARDQQRKARLVGEKPRKPPTERAVAAEDENFEVRWSGQGAVASPHSASHARILLISARCSTRRSSISTSSP